MPLRARFLRCDLSARLACVLAAATIAGAALPGAAAAESRLPDDLSVRVCEGMGPGFRAVAGSETCIRVGGRVDARMGIVSGSGGSRSVSSVRGRARLEAVTPTEFGQFNFVIDVGRDLKSKDW